MARMTKRVMARASKVLKAGGHDPEFSVTAIGKASDPKWIIGTVFNNGTTIVNHEVADDNGKVKSFGTIDSALKFVSGVSESSNGEYFDGLVQTGAIFASSVPSDIYADAERKIAALTKTNVAQGGKVTALTAMLAGPMDGWDTGNAAQVARYAEVTAQLGAVTADVAELSALIVEYQAIVDSEP